MTAAATVVGLAKSKKQKAKRHNCKAKSETMLLGYCCRVVLSVVVTRLMISEAKLARSKLSVVDGVHKLGACVLFVSCQSISIVVTARNLKPSMDYELDWLVFVWSRLASRRYFW